MTEPGRDVRVAASGWSSLRGSTGLGKLPGILNFGRIQLSGQGRKHCIWPDFQVNTRPTAIRIELFCIEKSVDSLLFLKDRLPCSEIMMTGKYFF